MVGYLHPMMQEVLDHVIQKFWLPAYVKKTHLGPTKIFFDDNTMFALQTFLTQQGLTMEDVVFMSSPPTTSYPFASWHLYILSFRT